MRSSGCSKPLAAPLDGSIFGGAMDPPDVGTGGGIVIHSGRRLDPARLDPWPGVTRSSGSWLWIGWIVWFSRTVLRAARWRVSGVDARRRIRGQGASRERSVLTSRFRSAITGSLAPPLAAWVGSGRPPPCPPSSQGRASALRLHRRSGSRKRRDRRGHSRALAHEAAAKWISPKAPLKGQVIAFAPVDSRRKRAAPYRNI